MIELFEDINLKLSNIKTEVDTQNSGEAKEALILNLETEILSNNDNIDMLTRHRDFYRNYIFDLELNQYIDVDDDYFELNDIDNYIIDTNSLLVKVEELTVEYQNLSLYSLFNKELRDFYNAVDYLELSDYSSEHSYNEAKRIKEEELNDAIYRS